MGLFDFWKKKPPQTSEQIVLDKIAEPGKKTADFQPPKTRTARSKGSQELSRADKERQMVERISLEDMTRFSAIPYLWDSSIQKNIQPGGHPFAYMELSEHNINAAKFELQKVNVFLSDANKCSKIIPKHIVIPVDQLVFTAQKGRGHTLLKCTPYTLTGKAAQYPVSLVFMTDLSSNKNSSHGELHYLQNGDIGKASIYLWRNGCGYFFYFKTICGALTLSKIDHIGKSEIATRTIYEIPRSK